MRKLKAFLIVLFTMALSFTLFACGGKKKEENPGPGPGPGPSTGNTITQIDDPATLQLTDMDTAESFTTKLAQVTLTYNAPPLFGQTMSGADCTVGGQSNIVFGEVGKYTVTLTPKENNSANLSATLVVEIGHAFGEEVDGVSTCAKDGATRTRKTEDVQIYYGTFHEGTRANIPEAAQAEWGTNKVFNAGANSSGRITEFGIDGMSGAEVPTITAGRLEPGMSITITGEARTDWEIWNQAENKYWNAPSFGIADPYYDGNGWADNYLGGSSVIVRSEGWVLYDGIGNSPRRLASLPAIVRAGEDGGANDKANYGSHPSDPGTTWQPEGFNASNRPEFASSDWALWTVYSDGQPTNSGDQYQDWTDLRITWTYRTIAGSTDGVIEMVYEYDYNNAAMSYTLTSYIKVPEAQRGYYDTIIHGDYSSMKIYESTVIETLTATDMTVNGVKAGEKTTYAAGETFDATTIDVQIQYAQDAQGTTRAYTINNSQVYYYTGETQTVAAAEADLADNAKWAVVGDNLLTSAMKIFKVQVEKSGETLNGLILNGNESAITVVDNNVAQAFGYDYNAALANNKKVGELTRSVANGNIVYTLANGVVQAIPAGEFAQATAEYRYIAFKLVGIEKFTTVNATVTSGAYVQATVDGDGNVLVALAFTKALAAEPIVISGIQDTPIAIVLGEGVIGFDVTSTAEKVTSTTEATGTWALNDGGAVKVTYQIPAGKTEADYYGIKIAANGGDATRTIAQLKNGNSFGNTVGATASGYAYDAAANTITVTFTFGAFNLAAGKMPAISLLDAGTREAVVTDYVDYVIAFNENVEGAMVENGIYMYAENGVLYLVKATAANNINLSDAAFAVGSLTLNVNTGNLDAVKLLNLGYSYNSFRGVFAFTDSELPEGISISYTAFGTVENVYDADLGALVIIAIDTKTALGMEGDLSFDLGGSADGVPSYFYRIVNGAVIKYIIEDAEDLELELIEDGDCYNAGVVAYVIKDDEGQVIFYAGLQYVGGSHKDSDNDGSCDLCGAAMQNRALTAWGGSVEFKMAEGDIIDMKGTFASTVTEAAGNWGPIASIIDGANTRFWLRTDGFFIGFPKQAWWTPATNLGPANALGNVDNASEDMFTTLDYNTLNGVLTLEEEALDTSALGAYFAGKTFHYITSYVDGTIKIDVYIYNPDGTLSLNYYVEIYNVKGNVTLQYTSDPGASVAGNVTFAHAKAIKSALSGAEAADVEGYAASTSLTFTATKKTTVDALDLLTVSGAASKSADGAPASHYLAFQVNFTQALVATTFGTLLDAQSNVVEGAIVKLSSSRTAMLVYIPVDSADELTFFTLAIKNFEASTVQSNITIDVSKVLVSDVAGALSGTANLNILGGTFTLEYNLADAGSYKIQVNENDAVALSALTGAATAAVALGDGLSVTGYTVANGKITLTLTLAALDLTKAVGNITISLLDGTGALVTSNAIAPLKATGAEVDATGWYAIAEGTTLTFVTNNPVTASMLATINAGAKTDKALLGEYELAYTAAGAFVQTNAITKNATLVISTVGSTTLTAITIDLTSFGVTADTVYGYTFGGKIYTVDAGRSITGANAETGNKATVQAHGCEVDGIRAWAVGEVATATFFYGVEIERASHTFPAEGGVCSVCDKVTGWSADFEIGNKATLNVADLTKGYDPADNEKFGAITKGQKVIIAADMLATTTEGYVNMAGFQLKVGGLWFRNDGWIDALGAAQGNYAANSWKIATAVKFNGGAADWESGKIPALKANSEVIITIDWTTENTIIVTMTINGANGDVYVQTNTITSTATGGAFAKDVYEVAIAPWNGYLKGTISAVADKEVVSAENCNPILHVHNYDPETDRCPDDGALNPNHQHTWEGLYCKVCGALNSEHAHNYVNGACTICSSVEAWKDNLTSEGWTKSELTTTEAANWGWYTMGGNNTLKAGQTMYVLGTLTSNMANNWDNLCAELNPGYTLRSDNFGWEFNNNGFLGAYNTKTSMHVYTTANEDIWTGDWALWQAIGKNITFRVAFDWSDVSKIVVAINATANEGTYQGYTYVMTYEIAVSNTSITSTLIDVAADGVTGATCYGYKLVGEEADVPSTSVDPAHAHVYENGTCTLCEAAQPASAATDWTAIDGIVNKNLPAWDSNVWSHTLNKGEKIVVLGSMTQDFSTKGDPNAEGGSTVGLCNWYSVVMELAEGYTLRADNAGWNFGDGATNFGAHAGTKLAVLNTAHETVAGDFWTVYREIASNCNWRMEADWTGNALVFTVTLTNTTSGNTFVCSYSLPVINTALNVVTFKMGGDHVDSLTVSAYKAI